MNRWWLSCLRTTSPNVTFFKLLYKIKRHHDGGAASAAPILEQVVYFHQCKNGKHCHSHAIFYTGVSLAVCTLSQGTWELPSRNLVKQRCTRKMEHKDEHRRMWWHNNLILRRSSDDDVFVLKSEPRSLEVHGRCIWSDHRLGSSSPCESRVRLKIAHLPSRLFFSCSISDPAFSFSPSRFIFEEYTPTNFDTFPAAIMTVFQVWLSQISSFCRALHDTLHPGIFLTPGED